MADPAADISDGKYIFEITKLRWAQVRVHDNGRDTKWIILFFLIIEYFRSVTSLTSLFTSCFCEFQFSHSLVGFVSSREKKYPNALFHCLTLGSGMFDKFKFWKFNFFFLRFSLLDTQQSSPHFTLLIVARPACAALESFSVFFSISFFPSQYISRCRSPYSKPQHECIVKCTKNSGVRLSSTFEA